MIFGPFHLRKRTEEKHLYGISARKAEIRAQILLHQKE
jgi:hypothetical protein